MGRVIETLVTEDVSRQRPGDIASPSASLSSHSMDSSQPLDISSTAIPLTTFPVRSETHTELDASEHQASSDQGQEQEPETVVEGSSSFSAHSKLAIDFLHKVAGADRQKGYTFETKELLDSLHQIVDAVKNLRLSPQSLFTPAQTLASAGDKGNMPDIQAAVGLIQKAQGMSNCFFYCRTLLMSTLFIPQLNTCCFIEPVREWLSCIGHHSNRLS